MTAGLPVPALLYFMYSTMSISLPLAVLFFCWIATMWRGAMSFETPMLFAIGFIVLFGIAGLTGWCWPTWPPTPSTTTATSWSPTSTTRCSPAASWG
jgi:heme/copper-type cytochrome/quinol oxidase subunit 1